MANRPQSTPLFSCCNGKEFTIILLFFYISSNYIFISSFVVTFYREIVCPMHTSPLLQSNVLIATQWRLPVCKTCTKGDSLITLNCNACPKTGSYRPFTSAISFIIFWDFLMLYQIFLSPRVKGWEIITYKHGIYGLSHELPNDLRSATLCEVQPHVTTDGAPSIHSHIPETPPPTASPNRPIHIRQWNQ